MHPPCIHRNMRAISEPSKPSFGSESSGPPPNCYTSGGFNCAELSATIHETWGRNTSCLAPGVWQAQKEQAQEEQVQKEEEREHFKRFNSEAIFQTSAIAASRTGLSAKSLRAAPQTCETSQVEKSRYQPIQTRTNDDADLCRA